MTSSDPQTAQYVLSADINILIVQIRRTKLGEGVISLRVFAGERQSPSLNPRLPCLTALSAHLAQQQTSELLNSLGADSSELGYLLSLSTWWFFQFLLHCGARTTNPRLGRNSEMHGENLRRENSEA